MNEVPTLPVGPLDLLVKAALAPPPVATSAWADWRRAYALDETPWNEVRLLGAVAERIAWLEPEADILPRIRGIQKFLYAQSQLCLVGAMGGLRILAAAGIPMLFMKGAGRVAADDGVARERLVRDIDVLVPIDRRDEAFELLIGGGWELNGQWQHLWHAINSLASHHAWSLSKGKGEIDLHHFSNHLNRLVGDDDALWARARRTVWRGLEVHVPSPTDTLLLAVVHGLRWSRDLNSDWIIDALRAMSSGAVDWDLLVAEAGRRHVAALLHAGLSYMQGALAAPVPEAVLSGLQSLATPTQQMELALYSHLAVPFDVRQNAVVMAMAAERCGSAPGPGSPAGGSVPLFDAKLGTWQTLDLAVAIQRGWRQITLSFESPAPPGTRLIGMIFSLGMLIDYRKVKQGAPGTAATLTLSLDPQLLRRRGLTSVVLRIIDEDGPAPFIPWGIAQPPE